MSALPLRRLADDFAGLIFPRLCASCGNNLLREEEGFCLSCELELPRTFDELNPTDNPVSRTFWGRIPLEGAAACFSFTGPGKVQGLIHNLKYNGRKDAGIAAGRFYGRIIKQISPFLTADYILPVPLHPDRLRERGYNQAACFGEGLSLELHAELREDLLIRSVATQTQTRRNREERWNNVGEVFQLKDPALLKDKHVILTDDVITTGATIEACALPLLSVPGIEISIVSIASARS